MAVARWTRTALLCAFLTVLAACGEKSPPTAVTPNPPVVTPPASTTLKATVSVVDGLTGMPVMGVTVTELVGATVDGSRVTADAKAGSAVTLTAPGYAVYQTAWTDRKEFVMWPIEGANSPQIIQEMNYGLNSPGVSNPGLRTAVVLKSPITFVLPVEMPAENVAQWQKLSAKLQPIVGYAVNGSVGSNSHPGSATCQVVLDPNIGPPAQTTRYLSSGVITGCLIELRYWGITDYTVAHEAGHAVGWSHHSGRGRLGSQGGDENGEYSQLEIDNGRMLVRLMPNTRDVYNDRAVLAPSFIAFSSTSMSGKFLVDETGWRWQDR